jgi:hypothetical protein
MLHGLLVTLPMALDMCFLMRPNRQRQNERMMSGDLSLMFSMAAGGLGIARTGPSIPERARRLGGGAGRPETRIPAK